MLVVEHHNIGQELVHMMVQVHLMYFHMLVVVFADSLVDNLFVVVEKQQLNHVELVVLDHLLLHMDHHDNLYKHHTHYKKNIFILLKKEKIINRDGAF
jgi:hypothetical protein